MEDEDDLTMSSNKFDETSNEEQMLNSQSFDLQILRKTYLLIYNLWQFLGFSYIFLVLVSKYSKFGSGKMHILQQSSLLMLDAFSF